MRENRTYGSEGGGAQPNALSLPPINKRIWRFSSPPFPLVEEKDKGASS